MLLHWLLGLVQLSVIKNTYRVGSAGIQTSALLFGGSTSSPFTFFADTQEYNGSGFSSGGAMSQARWGLRGAGTQTAGLGFAGYIGPPGPPSKNSALTEEYDGSSWTSGGAMGTGRYALGGAGTQTSALAFGGKIYPGSDQTATEEYDGSSWTAGGALPSARTRLSGCGPSNSDALAVGHQTSGVCSTYDGTSWTDTGSLGTARYRGGSSGSTSSAITYGGSTHPGVTSKNLTESFDGSTWSTNPATMGTARYGFGYAGTKDSALAMSGYDTALTGVTEEYNFSAQVVTGAAWSSGGTYPATALQLGGSGTQTAGLGFGGTGPGGNPNGLNTTAEYDGASWTAGGNLNNGKATGSRSGVGTQTSTMCINLRNDGVATPDYPIPPSNHNYRALDNVEEYNGSSWSNGTVTPDAEVETGTCGTVSAALRFGGNPGNPPAGPATNSTIYWNDTSWTSLNNMSTARYGLAPAFQGAYTAALGFGGYSTTNVTSTEEFDGTNWTAGGNLITAISRHMGTGTQTAALSFGGPPGITRTEGYDGTAWSTRPTMSNGRHFSGAAGSNTAALCISGGSSTNVEEFTGETTSANTVDITTAE